MRESYEVDDCPCGSRALCIPSLDYEIICRACELAVKACMCLESDE